MLEQAAANASFSSNSSLVVKVLERAKSQKPGHQTSDRKGENTVKSSRGMACSYSSFKLVWPQIIFSLVFFTDSQVPSILSPVDTGYGSGEGRSTGSVIIGSQAGSMSSVEDASTMGKNFVRFANKGCNLPLPLKKNLLIA